MGGGVEEPRSERGGGVGLWRAKMWGRRGFAPPWEDEEEVDPDPLRLGRALSFQTRCLREAERTKSGGVLWREAAPPGAFGHCEDPVLL